MNTSISSLQFTLTNGALLSSIVKWTNYQACRKKSSLPAPYNTKINVLADTSWYFRWNTFLPCVTHEQLCLHKIDGTLKKHAIIEMEECTIKRLDDVEGTYCLVVFKFTALDHQANQIGEPTNMMRDPLKRQQSKAQTHLANLTCDFTARIKPKLERRALLRAETEEQYYV